MTETPQYDIIKTAGDYELRHYPAYIKAEVDIPGSNYRKAIFDGFSKLAAYIFGGNFTTEKLAMTSPVQVSQSQAIAMTKPVTISGEGDYTVAFIMPSGFTLETLPKPKDPGIRFSVQNPQTVAVLSFKGFYRNSSVRKAKQRLSEWLTREGIEPAGDFIVAGYNPPWVPGFLTRNEVMIRIKAD
jgi:hypothetical protein